MGLHCICGIDSMANLYYMALNKIVLDVSKERHINKINIFKYLRLVIRYILFFIFTII